MLTPNFSVQYLLDCDDTNYGCDGGWMTDAYLWTIDHGVILESDYGKPYRRKAEKCSAKSSSPRFYNDGANEEATVTNQRLKEIVTQQPVGAAYHSVLKCMDFYKSGTLMPDDCHTDCSNPDKREVNHAITIVGYGKSERKGCDEYWLIKNSWGTTWGE
jgi:C1A family cysteine protease